VKESLDDELHEECGVVAIYANSGNISDLVYLGMQGIQHRGELGCGMATSYQNEIYFYKDIGLVGDVFQPKILNTLKGSKGIGHTRYATTSVNEFENKEEAVKKLHPMIGQLVDNSSFAVEFNGNLTNYNFLRKQLSNYNFETSTDTEVIKNLIIDEYTKEKSLNKSLETIYHKMQGAYNIIVLDNSGNIYALKDGHGFKPLSIGKLQNSKGYIISSETRSMEFIDAEFLRDINPGELIEIKNNKIDSLQLLPKRKAICPLEYVYFASIDSIIEGKTVNDARVRCGKTLYREQPLKLTELEKKDWRIFGVPDSGMPAATAYSNESGIKIRIGMARNRYYYKRTFINGNPNDRKKASKLNSEKYIIIKSAVEGKNIILIDDTIVRGTTTKSNVTRLREAGAKSVHVKVTFPGIIDPCYMGIDFPTHKELLSYKKSLEEICKEIGADSVQFISKEGLVRAINKIPDDQFIDLSTSGICLACTNNDYPCPVENELKLD
jgi:amidophosphoribosyltransferase